MRTICVKTNDLNKIDYLLKEFDNISLKDIYLSSYKFKIFQNVIIHYTGKDENIFISTVSEKIANTIEYFYQEKFINRIIKENYFYLEEEEQKAVLRITRKIVNSPECTLNCKKDILISIIYKYLEENKTMILDGFSEFRLQDYKKLLDYVTELSVFNYLNLTV